MGRKKSTTGGEVIETHRYTDQQKGILVWLFKKKQETGFNLFRWSVSEYLGRRPRPAESAGLSRTLLELQTLGDVELLDVRKRKNDDKRRRTTHVRLSSRGREIAPYLTTGADITRTWHHRTNFSNAGRYNALGIARELLEREQRRVSAILEEDPDDYTVYDLPGSRDGEQWDKYRVTLYELELGGALELFEEEQGKLPCDFDAGRQTATSIYFHSWEELDIDQEGRDGP